MTDANRIALLEAQVEVIARDRDDARQMLREMGAENARLRALSLPADEPRPDKWPPFVCGGCGEQGWSRESVQNHAASCMGRPSVEEGPRHEDEEGLKAPCERCGEWTSVQPRLCVDCLSLLPPASTPDADGTGCGYCHGNGCPHCGVTDQTLRSNPNGWGASIVPSPEAPARCPECENGWVWFEDGDIKCAACGGTGTKEIK